jgi:hypothetical protein
MVGLLAFGRLCSHLGFGNLRRFTKITKKPYYSQARSLSKEVSLIRRGAFKIAVLLTSIACSAPEAAAPACVFDKHRDRVPNLWEHFSQAAVILAFTNHGMSRIIQQQTSFIRHTATELQRRIAEQNAKAYYARLGAGKKNELKKKNIRYLAVSTVRSKQTSPKAKAVLMIWDIPRESLVGEYVYELDTAPTVGEVASYDKMRAEYIGKGPE